MKRGAKTVFSPSLPNRLIAQLLNCLITQSLNPFLTSPPQSPHFAPGRQNR